MLLAVSLGLLPLARLSDLDPELLFVVVDVLPAAQTSFDLWDCMDLD